MYRVLLSTENDFNCQTRAVLAHWGQLTCISGDSWVTPISQIAFTGTALGQESSIEGENEAVLFPYLMQSLSDSGIVSVGI